MTWNKIYWVYGGVIVLALGAGAWRGYSFTSTTEIKNVPKSVRDNPGSYRAIYAGYHHYTGGK